MMRFALAAVLLVGCRNLDRSTKTACNTNSDCTGFVATCVNNVCVDPYGSSPQSSGVTAPTSKPCVDSDACGYDKVCDDGVCRSPIERDYEQTRSAFKRMLCQTLSDVCGETRMTTKYGSDPVDACFSDSEPPWGLTIGPNGAVIKQWSALEADRCVEDTRGMLLRGVTRRTFSLLPDSCLNMGSDDTFGSTCDYQIECSTDSACTKPVDGLGKWECVYYFADFGEVCYDRTKSGENLSARFESTCHSDHYCDIRGSGTCKKRVAAGKPCLTQFYSTGDNDPVFDPCTSGYMCSESSGLCEPFAPTCPLP